MKTKYCLDIFAVALLCEILLEPQKHAENSQILVLHMELPEPVPSSYLFWNSGISVLVCR